MNYGVTKSNWARSYGKYSSLEKNFFSKGYKTTYAAPANDYGLNVTSYPDAQWTSWGAWIDSGDSQSGGTIVLILPNQKITSQSLRRSDPSSAPSGLRGGQDQFVQDNWVGTSQPSGAASQEEKDAWFKANDSAWENLRQQAVSRGRLDSKVRKLIAGYSSLSQVDKARFEKLVDDILGEAIEKLSNDHSLKNEDMILENITLEAVRRLRYLDWSTKS